MFDKLQFVVILDSMFLLQLDKLKFVGQDS
jgi:hypothetical protein